MLSTCSPGLYLWILWELPNGEKKLPLWKAAEELFGHLQPQHVAWDPTAGFVEGHAVPIDATLSSIHFLFF